MRDRNGLCMNDDATPATSPASPAQAPVWGLMPTVMFSALIAFATLFLQSMVLLMVFIDPQTFSDAQAVQQRFNAMAREGSALSVAALTAMVVVWALVSLAIRLKPGAHADSYLGLHLPSWPAASGWLRWLAVYVVIHELLTLALGRPMVNPFMTQMVDSADSRWLLVIALLIAAPISEEVFFRGFLFEGLARSRLGGRAAVVLTAAVWAAIHTQYDAFDMSSVFIIGLLLGAARLRSGSLWLCVGLHAALNLVALLQLTVVRSLG